MILVTAQPPYRQLVGPSVSGGVDVPGAGLVRKRPTPRILALRNASAVVGWVSPHVIRHTTAMHPLQAGVDVATIALWLGHERLETTHHYVEADLQLKEIALRKLDPLGQSTRRFKADSSLMTFLASL